MATAHNASTPSTRYQTTEYNRAHRLESRLKDIYSSAPIFHLSHSAILDTLQRDIYSTADWKKLKTYYRGHFAGIRETLSDNLYRYHLEWRVRLDGKLVKSEDVPKGAWDRVTMGEHVYSDKPDAIFSTPAKGS
jgi:hypothetical protein